MFNMDEEPAQEGDEVGFIQGTDAMLLGGFSADRVVGPGPTYRENGYKTCPTLEFASSQDGKTGGACLYRQGNSVTGLGVALKFVPPEPPLLLNAPGSLRRMKLMVCS